MVTRRAGLRKAREAVRPALRASGPGRWSSKEVAAGASGPCGGEGAPAAAILTASSPEARRIPGTGEDSTRELAGWFPGAAGWVGQDAARAGVGGAGGASGGAVGAPTRVGSCSGRVPRNRLRVSSRKASEMRMRMAATTSAAGFSSRGEPPPTTPAREKAPPPPRAPAPVRGGAGGAARDLASSLPLPARDGQCEGECRAAHGRGDPRGGGGGARGGRRGAVHALHDLRAARLPGRAAAARLRAGRGVGRAGPERRGADEAVPRAE